MTGSVAGIRRRRTVAGRRETPHLPPDRDFYGQTLRKLGGEAFERVYAIMSKQGYPYFANYGTLLGVVRENGYVKNDDDIDLSVPANTISAGDLVSAFQKEDGFGTRHKFFMLMTFIALCRDNPYYGVGTIFEHSMPISGRGLARRW